MRAFIAIDLPKELKEKISSIIEKLANCDLEAKWVKPENVHMTLKFLGQIEEKQIDTIKSIISEVSLGFKKITVECKDFGFFPNEKRPRVFFLKTDKEDQLRKIYQELEDKLSHVGFEKEERFKSHLTLCRFKGRKNMDCLIRELKNIDFSQKLKIDEIAIFKSTLTKTGPIYEKVFTASLAI